MTDRLTQALIYESQGFKKDALIIYKEILKDDPDNRYANEGIKRIVKSKVEVKYNKKMLELFYSEDKEDIDKFKRWLVQI
ncbi:hypothetical protein CBLAS_0699 [Campylobacter blaseri]|uniref:Tetratricopeptide repeat protein n=1 Tax=Campylobacter blaseri TaxID=2042961 RepID=A0A2P8R282_9BACT|nr:hypothetical protein [Campylobacter blaseri]PSM52592.1 hypothetical protein CQ405_02355 [Campylobacter blaseri]PSM54240.1 hypothetical protein CRN67_02355 [Campylobacter blaseri]QKF85890.1 hypothetical protein CBLAS_0699 [Campylobacter blaseri]